MIDVAAPVIARLAAESELLLDVDGPASLAAMRARNITPPRMPAAWVFSLGWDAQASAYATGVTDQQVTETLGLVFAVSATGDRTGARAAGDVGAVLREAVSLLHGWRPTALVDDEPVPLDCDPLELGRWRLLAMEQGILWGQLDLRTRHHVRDGD